MAQSTEADFIAVQAALAGQYSLDREVGRGGMGIVYLAREVRLARPVAIKVLPPAFAQRADLRDAFLSESRTAAQLNHPNIVPVYAAGEAGGFAYIAMAYVEGITLGQRIRSRGPLLPGQAARVLREVAWALAYAHGAGFVHRDVSAENIMLEHGTERAIVMDFGIASAMQTSAIGVDGNVVGNPYYVSPEQIAGEPLNARSDLYSLGVTGFYALTGRLPFTGETSADVITQHLTTSPPSITSVASSVPPRLAAAVERCLHKEPIRRYRNAESFAEAIDLAFEHAKEIPAPLRSWINQGQVELPARLALVAMGSMSGLTLALTFNRTSLFFYNVAAMAVLSYVPWTRRLRRVLLDGFTTDDLHASLREHQLVRAEEVEYERQQVSPLRQRIMRITFGVLTGVVGLATYTSFALEKMVSDAWVTGGQSMNTAKHIFPRMDVTELRRVSAVVDDIRYLALLPALALLTIVGVPLAGTFIRYRLASRIAAAGIKFWKSIWGKRVAKVTLFGKTPAERATLGMPVLTEVALGRATDNLFNALPRVQRKQLAALPVAVRRLEEDATRLREGIGAIDDQLAAFEMGAEDRSRNVVAVELRASRAETTAKLSATVSAIENIRLDLLRLQMGAGGIESVTASLEAAQRVGDELSSMARAQDEINRLIAASNELSPIERADVDDDADTPVHGVPAAGV